MPGLALIFDLIFRFHDLRNWGPRLWAIYLLSFLVSIAIWQAVLLSTFALKRVSRIAAGVTLAIIALGFGFIYIATYRAYVYFKFIPNTYIISYIYSESEHFFKIVRDYLPPLLAIMFAIGGLMWALAWLGARDQTVGIWRKKPVWISGSVILIACLLVLSNNLPRYDQASVPDTNFLLLSGQTWISAASGRQFGSPDLKARAVPNLAQLNRPMPFNILIVLNESLRPDHMTIYGYPRETTPLLKKFFAQHPEEVFLFPHNQANAISTQFSVPLILHGLNLSVAGKYWHTAPMIFEYVKKFPGAHAYFISSQRLNWNNMDKYLASPALDLFWSRETSDLPSFNDLGIDDRVTAQTLRKQLLALDPARDRFLAVFHTNTNHSPYYAPSEFEVFKGGTTDQYDDSVRFLDAVVGGTLDWLDQQGWLENTVVIFTSDHSEFLGERGIHGHSFSNFEEVTHIPLWIYIPKELQASIRGIENLRRNTGQMTSNQDLTPTILDLLGLSEEPEEKEWERLMQGNSLLRELDPARPILIVTQSDLVKINIAHQGLAVVMDGKKYLLERAADASYSERLYDLYQDPHEQHDLWGSWSEAGKKKFHDFILSNPGTRAIYEKALGKPRD